MFLTLLLSTVIISIVIYLLIRIPSNLKHIPSLPAYKWVINFFEEKPIDIKWRETTFEQLRKTQITRFWMPGKWVVLTSSVESAKRVYGDLDVFPKTIPQENHPNMVFSKFMGVNLVFSNNEQWKRMRKVVNPLFKRHFEVDHMTEILRNFIDLVDNKYSNHRVDVNKYAQKITMDALGKGIMGIDFNSVVEDNVPFINCYNEIVNKAGKPLYLIFPFLDHPKNPFRKPVFDTLDRLEGHFHDILESKRNLINCSDVDELASNSKTDLLTMMCLAKDDENIHFTEKEIRDNIMIFLIAGHDTTAFTISAALHFLAIYPEVQERAREEIFSIMGIDKNNSKKDHKTTAAPTVEETKKMVYLMSVMKETMRLYPSISRLPFRTCVEDTELDGHFIPKGAEISLDVYAMHRDPINFKDPDSFKPERFYESSGNPPVLTEKKDPPGYTPFGGGTRFCIGNQFSILEQKVVLSMILSRYRLQYSTGHGPVDPDSPTSLKLKNIPFFVTEPTFLDFIPLYNQS